MKDLKMRSTSARAALVAALAVLLLAGRAQGGSFTGLGDLGGPAPGTVPYVCNPVHYSQALAVSGDGTTVVGQSYAATPEGFRWTSGTGMVGIGDLPGGGDYNTGFGSYYVLCDSGELT